MVLILATEDGREIRRVTEDIDIDLGDTNDFELTVPYSSWKKYGDIEKGMRLYVPDTEYGGRIEEIEGSTKEDCIYVRGYTWRGYLGHQVISPASGEDYYTISGELNDCIAELLTGRLGNWFYASSDDTGISVSSFQFSRYCTLLEGMTKMLKRVGYRPEIRYVQDGTGGYVEVGAVPIEDYSDDVEISQNSRLYFTSHDYSRGVNHLICLGSGELADRTVVHLYADADGNVTTTQYYTGIDEIVDVYDYSSAEDEDALTEGGTERLLEKMNYSAFEAQLGDVDDIGISIGDTISGRDYITGVTVTQPVTNKILRRSGGIETIEYKLEGQG